MREFALIARLTQELTTHAGVVLGPGDDCAALDCGVPGKWLLFKTDAVVEGVHFTPDADPERVGHKALARCLSDVAAMGGVASSAVITLGLPSSFREERVIGLYRGLNRLAARWGVAVVGGETTRNPESLLISVALLGWVEPENLVRRSGAKPGQAVFVTGTLGGSQAGKHLDFEPRLAESRWLVTHYRPSSMIDLSDGLAGDLRHVLQASGVGADIRVSSLPISRAARQVRGERATVPPPWVRAVTDGEDFELLFTVEASQAVPLLDAWRSRFSPLELTCVGKITEHRGIRWQTPQGVRPLNLDGYIHFA
jgi:thiamine-monophosphate kinase